MIALFEEVSNSDEKALLMESNVILLNTFDADAFAPSKCSDSLLDHSRLADAKTL
jgi:hypothetical protein